MRRKGGEQKAQVDGVSGLCVVVAVAFFKLMGTVPVCPDLA